MKTPLRTLSAFLFSMVMWAPAQAIQPQIASNWCWASAVQDVLFQRGLFLSQPQVAARLTGWPQNRPAYTQEVAMLLNSFGVQALYVPQPGAPGFIANHLMSGRKIIVLARPNAGPVGHFIVLQGFDPNSGMVAVADPANGQTSLYPLFSIYNGWNMTEMVVVG